MEQFLFKSVELGGTVFTVVAFLWYLMKRDATVTKSLISESKNKVILARALQRLTDKLGENTVAVAKNAPITEKNTEAITASTKIIKKNGGGK